MKKTIIALIALAGVAAAATENTVDVTTNLMPTPTKPITWKGTGSGTDIDLKWDGTFSGNACEEAAIFTELFENFDITTNGCYAFNQYGSSKNSNGASLSNDTITIKALSSDGSGSMFFVAMVSVSDLLQENDFGSLNSITLSLTGNSGTSDDTWFSVYSMDATSNTLTTVLEMAASDSSSLKNWDGTKSYTIGADSLNATDNIALLVRHNKSTDLTFTNLTATANLTIPSDTPAVPEPTTATLSLLALAGLAARRRRK